MQTGQAEREVGVEARPLRAALVGAGRIGEAHLDFLRRSPAAALAGLCDRSRALAEFAAQRAGIGAVYTDLGEMLDAVRPDVVHILTPPHTHVALTSDCLNAGAHVIVEKPIAPTRAEFRRLWDLAQARGRRLIEDHNYRFNAPVQALRRLAEGGRLGEIREVEVRMALDLRAEGSRYADRNLPHPSHRLPAGVLHEFLPHLAYLALLFLPRVAAPGDRRFDRLTAVWSNHGGGPLFAFDDLDALAVAGPLHARIRFTCHTHPEGFTVAVRGTRGSAVANLFQPHVQVDVPRRGGPLGSIVNQYVNGRSLCRAARSNFVDKLLSRNAYEGLHVLLELAYDALARGTEPPVTFEDMDGTQALIEALLAEARPI
jgi:predicted dehydrogenase